MAPVDQRLGEPVHRIAAVVLGNRERLAGAGGGVRHERAGLDRKAHRLLDADVDSRVERAHRKLVVHSSVGGDVQNIDARPVVEHFAKVGVNDRLPAKQVFSLPGNVSGGRVVTVADRNQLKRPERIRSLRYSVNVPKPHAAAAYKRHSQCHVKNLPGEFPVGWSHPKPSPVLSIYG